MKSLIFPGTSSPPHLPKCRQWLEEKCQQLPDTLSNLSQVPGKELHLFRYSSGPSVCPLPGQAGAVWQVRVSHSMTRATSKATFSVSLCNVFLRLISRSPLPQGMLLFLAPHLAHKAQAVGPGGWWHSGGQGPACHKPSAATHQPGIYHWDKHQGQATSC